MNNAYHGIRSDTNGGPAEITQIGAGELRIDRAPALTIYAYQVEDGLPSLGLGLVDVDANKVIVWTVKVINLLKDPEQLLSFKASFRLKEKKFFLHIHALTFLLCGSHILRHAPTKFNLLVYYYYCFHS